MGAFREHKETSLSQAGVEIDIATVTSEPLVLLNPFGDIALAHNVRIIEMDSDKLDPELADDLDDLDRIENDLRVMITWLNTMPEGEDREFLLLDLGDLLNDVPYAREMLALEVEAETAHEAVEV